ncbi:MAG: hypothetical protein M1816_002311 [Peltula sp. TS41687]|nr:MAG: hypothetical protein M1816_002311 [Peltula sp. TS41687]
MHRLQRRRSQIQIPILNDIKTSCSIPCYKAHRASHTADERKTAAATTQHDSLSSQPTPQPELETQDGQKQQQASTTAVTSPTQPQPPPQPQRQPQQRPYDFTPLQSSSELQLLLTQHPQLHAQLQKIYHVVREPSPEPSADEDVQHVNPGGRGGGVRDRGRGGGGRGGVRQQQRKHWSEEKSMKEGLWTLTRTRESPRENSDGLEEFKQLVLRLCVPQQQQQQQPEDTSTITSTPQQQGQGHMHDDRVADGEEDVVATLLKGLG